MPKISIVDRNAREYQQWLGPETPDHLTPRALSSELVLTHEWQPGHHVLESRIVNTHAEFSATGAGWCSPQELVAASTNGLMRYVLRAGVYLTAPAATARAILIGAYPTNSMVNMRLVASTMVAGGTPGGAAFIAHPVLLLPGEGLFVSFYAIAAAEVMELNSSYADYRCCEPLPRL